jgi:cell fate (sporulation/competence/biofilm development) regulator YlbF (YheA/YmcA/DUF963 family)
METTNLDSRERVLRRTEEFIGALKATSVVRRFDEAARRLEADQEVQSLLGVLRRFQQAQQNGGLSSSELEDVRDAQARIRNHQVVQEFLAAREAVGVLFKETNLAISEILGLDFGQTVSSPRCSC